MATSSAGPVTSSPEIVTVPSVGWISPEMIRKRVDLPLPDRPSRATISPVLRLIETALSTGLRLSPEPVEKTWLTLSTFRSVVTAVSSIRSSSQKWPRASESQAALGEGVEPAPEQAVHQRDEDRHHRHAEHDFRKVALVSRLCDIGADALGGDCVVLPLDIFGDDRGVPRATRGGDRAGQIV